MSIKRKQYGTAFKAKVAKEAIEGNLTASQIASKHGVHTQQVQEWKAKALKGLSSLFERKNKKSTPAPSEDLKELQATIGRQKMDIDFLKQGLGLVNEP